MGLWGAEPFVHGPGTGFGQEKSACKQLQERDRFESLDVQKRRASSLFKPLSVYLYTSFIYLFLFILFIPIAKDSWSENERPHRDLAVSPFGGPRLSSKAPIVA